jgi:hypothetical protein
MIVFLFLNANLISMARATRVEFPGAWYHVLNRGIERRYGANI